MKYLNLSIMTALALMAFSSDGFAHEEKMMMGANLESQDPVNEVGHGVAVLPGELAHRYEEDKFPPVGDIPMMGAPKEVEKGDLEKIGIR